MLHNNHPFRGVKRWSGIGFRVEPIENDADASGIATYRFKQGLKASDVLKYESVEMENHYDLDLPPGTMNHLEKIPASNLVWVCRFRDDAEMYGEPEEVIEVSDIHNGYILAEDGNGGYLVLREKE